MVSNPKGTPVPNPRSFGEIVDFRFTAKKVTKTESQRSSGHANVMSKVRGIPGSILRPFGKICNFGLQTLVESERWSERPNEHFWSDPHAITESSGGK